MARKDSNGSSAVERLPPQSLEAEMSLLGSMLLNREAVGEVLAVVGPSDTQWFYRPDHQVLFETLVEMYDAREPIDLVTVREALRRKHKLEEIGGTDYLLELAQCVPTWVNAPHYAGIVRDKGMLRDLIRCCGGIMEEAYGQVSPAREIMDQAEQAVFKVTERRISGQAVLIREPIHEVVHQLESREAGAILGVDTGFHELDELTSGLQRGDLIIIAGRPSMGKTAFGLCIAEHMAVDCNRPVAFFSMEMSKTQVVQRLLCSRAKVDSHLVRRNMLNDVHYQDLLEACNLMEHAPLFVDDTPGMTAMELRAKARRLSQSHKIEAIFVDYLQLMHLPRAESRQAEVAAISRGLKALGRELNVPIVALAQLNRNPEERESNRPRMSDLRESGAIEQDADVIMLLHREEYYKPNEPTVKGLAEVIVAKQRNGPTGSVKVVFDNRLTAFRNYSHVPEPGQTSNYEEAPF